LQPEADPRFKFNALYLVVAHRPWLANRDGSLVSPDLLDERLHPDRSVEDLRRRLAARDSARAGEVIE
jgi:hypothetical protein